MKNGAHDGAAADQAARKAAEAAIQEAKAAHQRADEAQAEAHGKPTLDEVCPSLEPAILPNTGAPRAPLLLAVAGMALLWWADRRVARSEHADR